MGLLLTSVKVTEVSPGAAFTVTGKVAWEAASPAMATVMVTGVAEAFLATRVNVTRSTPAAAVTDAGFTSTTAELLELARTVLDPVVSPRIAVNSKGSSPTVIVHGQSSS